MAHKVHGIARVIGFWLGKARASQTVAEFAVHRQLLPNPSDAVDWRNC